MLIVTALALALLVWLFAKPLALEHKRRRLRAQPFPKAWRTILRRRMPYFHAMPADLQVQLKKHIQVFIAEKPFIGCAGLTITDDIRVTVAAQACLLLLNRRTDYYPALRQVLVYPGAFVVERLHRAGGGVLQDRRQVLSGESWEEGQVILSWEDTKLGARHADDGHNVVIHEFAHQLDQETGEANGAPRLAKRGLQRRWAAVFSAAFAQLQHDSESGVESLFDDYGATNPAEFFAVASEVFFEQPMRMAAEHPAVYMELSGFYCVNPLSW
jgi:MtfA peptidase